MKIRVSDPNIQETIIDRLVKEGSNLGDYIEKPPAPLKTRYLLIPAFLTLLFLCILTLLPKTSPIWLANLLFIFSFLSGTWTCVSTQLRFKNGYASFIVAMGLIITMLVAAGFISPREAAEIVKGLRGK